MEKSKIKSIYKFKDEPTIKTKIKTKDTLLSKHKIIYQKTAKIKPIGSYYHPTSKTYRDGKCPDGYETKKGYVRHSYDKKDGKHIKYKYVHSTCIPNKGTPGKIFDNNIPFHLNKEHSLRLFDYKTTNKPNIRLNKLLQACKNLSYKAVVLRLSQLRTLTKNTNPKISNIYEQDMLLLQKWRKENPELYKNKKIF